MTSTVSAVGRLGKWAIAIGLSPDDVGRRRSDLRDHSPPRVRVQSAEGPQRPVEVVGDGHHPAVEERLPLARPPGLTVPPAGAADVLGELLILFVLGHGRTSDLILLPGPPGRAVLGWFRPVRPPSEYPCPVPADLPSSPSSSPRPSPWARSRTPSRPTGPALP